MRIPRLKITQEQKHYLFTSKLRFGGVIWSDQPGGSIVSLLTVRYYPGEQAVLSHPTEIRTLLTVSGL